jgi:hypothetical protein
LRLSFAVKVGFITDFKWLKILYKEFAVCRLFIFALFVNQPYYAETVLSAIISDTEDAANIGFPIWGSIITSFKAKNGPRWYDVRQMRSVWFHCASQENLRSETVPGKMGNPEIPAFREFQEAKG